MKKKIVATLLIAAWCSVSMAQQTVVGAPTATLVSPAEKVLEYRDPAQPLTIGEMSEKQAAETTEKFLNKHGFTTIKPAPVVTAAGAQAFDEVPPNQLRLLAIFGKPGEITAELSLNNTLHQVKGATALGVARVESVSSEGITASLVGKKTCKKARSKKNRICVTTTHQLAVGDVIEWRK